MGKAIDELPDKPSDENQCKIDQATLRDACLHLLGCNFDTVQIIATRHDAEDGSAMITWGEGNYYTRVGSTAAWLEEVT